MEAGRDPSEILLCAATKMNGSNAVREAITAGVDFHHALKQIKNNGFPHCGAYSQQRDSIALAKMRAIFMNDSTLNFSSAWCIVFSSSGNAAP